MRPAWSRAIAALFVAVATHAARAQSASQPNVCTTLTPDQVKAAFGAAVKTGVPIGTTGCAWNSADGSRPYLTLVVHSNEDWAKATAPLPGVTRTHFSGLGDDAVYNDVGPLTTLGVKKGATTIIVRVYGIDSRDQQKAIEKALAQTVLAKL